MLNWLPSIKELERNWKYIWGEKSSANNYKRILLSGNHSVLQQCVAQPWFVLIPYDFKMYLFSLHSDSRDITHMQGGENIALGNTTTPVLRKHKCPKDSIRGSWTFPKGLFLCENRLLLLSDYDRQTRTNRLPARGFCFSSKLVL